LWVEVEGKDISFLKLSSPTLGFDSSLTFELYYGTTTFSFPSIIEGDTYDLEDHTSS
jgi:hypothetical protein